MWVNGGAQIIGDVGLKSRFTLSKVVSPFVALRDLLEVMLFSAEVINHVKFENLPSDLEMR